MRRCWPLQGQQACADPSSPRRPGAGVSPTVHLVRAVPPLSPPLLPEQVVFALTLHLFGGRQTAEFWTSSSISTRVHPPAGPPCRQQVPQAPGFDSPRRGGGEPASLRALTASNLLNMGRVVGAGERPQQPAPRPLRPPAPIPRRLSPPTPTAEPARLSHRACVARWQVESRATTLLKGRGGAQKGDRRHRRATASPCARASLPPAPRFPPRGTAPHHFHCRISGMFAAAAPGRTRAFFAIRPARA